MILYGSSLSPFVRKVRIHAAEKGLALELVAAGLGGPAFAEASPFGKMPAFRDPGADDGRDFCISDSSAIIAYLEAKHPAPDLIPTAPIARARTIWYEEFADTILFATCARIFYNRFVAPKFLKVAGDEAAADIAIADLPRLFDYLEGIVPDSGFLVEDRMTVADIAVASPLVNMGYVGITVDPARWPRTAAYIDGIVARPSFATLAREERALVAAMG